MGNKWWKPCDGLGVIVTTFVQNYDTFSKDAIIKKEFMIGLVLSSSEVKRPYTST
jgi:hypothetical protein